jgi:ubiquinone/menaquinone biosynthesis C-methylase UbiE
MGFYVEHVLPRFQDKVMARKPMREIRARVCEGLAGEVVEVGFGTGLNTPYYPQTITQIDAVEPSRVCMRIAEPRIERSPVRVEPAGLNGERLELPSEQCDAALSTWTLCTIPDVMRALEEIRRVLKPGGTFHFVEHGHAPDAKVARWQARIEPVWKPLAGGCHLTRPIAQLIEKAGFTIEKLDNYYMDGEPKSFGYIYEGRATRA